LLVTDEVRNDAIDRQVFSEIIGTVASLWHAVPMAVDVHKIASLFHGRNAIDGIQDATLNRSRCNI
jgi:hypothetical protein